MAALDEGRHQERFGQIFVPAVFSRVHLAWCHAELGTFAEGLAIGEEGLRIAEAVGHPGSLMIAFWGASLPFLRQGDLPQALPLLERAVGICQDAGLPLVFPWIASPLGLAYALSGRVVDALPLLEQAIEQSASMGQRAYHALYVVVLGEGLLLAGRLEKACHHAERALALAREHKERGHEAWALRLLGEVAAQGAPPDAAEAATHYQQALALATELGMRPLVAHCHLGLGTLYARMRQAGHARSELTAAIELYRSMEMTFWLPQAEAVLAQMEGQS